jgi:TolB protein
MKNWIIILFYLTVIVSFSTNVSSQELIQLTNGSKASQQPCVSNSGNFIIYSSGIDYTTGGEGSGIWKMNLDGSNQTELLASDGSHNYNHPFINPNDDAVVFSKDRVGGGGGLWILYLNNLTEERITFNSEYEVGTEWSPNGNEIYFYAGPYGIDSNIKRLYLNNLTIEDVTNGTDKDAFPYLNPDGSKIVFNRVVNNNNFNIFIINSDGTNLIQVTDNNYKDYIPSWGSDNKIYFSSNRNCTGFDLWRMNTDGKNQERLTNFYGDEKWPEYTNHGIFFYWDKKSDNTGDIWLLELNQTPTPSPASLVLTTPSWRNVVSVSGLENTVFVLEENVTGRVADWIAENGPDHIYTLGFDAGLNNSYRIEYGDVPGLFYPNATQAVLVETETEGVLGSQIAGLLGIPLVFDAGGYPDVIDLRGIPQEGIMEMCADYIAAEGKVTNYLIAANTESGEFPLAARLAKKKVGFIVPVSIPEISYDLGSWEECWEVNSGNNIAGIVESLGDAAEMLGGKGLFSGSRDYLFGEPVYIALVGGFDSFPAVIVPDPGIELLENHDGDYMFSDVLFSDINRNGFFDAGLGRFSGGIEAISFQIENIGKTESDGVVIGQYRYQMYDMANFLGGGMLQAYSADHALSSAGMETERLVEKRMESLTPDVDWTNLVGLIFDIGEWLGSAAMGTIGMIYTALGYHETIIHAWLEFDWGDWYWHAGHGGFVELEHLPVFNGTLYLDGVGFLGYFGVGDEYWKIPPDDRDELELITDPYGRCENLKELDYGGFLYDDHDMSAQSVMVSDVMENGGASFTSTGLIHDPFTQRTSMQVIGMMSRGLSAGEAWMISASTLPIDPWFLAMNPNPFLRERPDLYLKDRYEHLVLGDPETSLDVEAPSWVHGDEFSVSPLGSFLAESQIVSEYYISGRMLFVENAETEILEVGEPVIPLFVREIILPEGSDPEDVSFEGYYRRYWWLRASEIPMDEHYEGGWEPIEYEDYWYDNYTLLDGRVLVRVFVPAVHYGRPSRVLYRGIVGIEYDTPAEMSVSTSEIRVGENETIEVTVFNDRDLPLNGTLLLWVGNESYSEGVGVGVHGTETMNFMFVPEEAGKYDVKAIFIGDMTVGPRYSSFTVSEKCWCGWHWCWKKRCGCGWLLGILSRTASLRHSMTCW